MIYTYTSNSALHPMVDNGAQYRATFAFSNSQLRGGNAFRDQTGYAIDAPDFIPAGHMEPVSKWNQVPVARYASRA
jgi:hypothetical protein